MAEPPTSWCASQRHLAAGRNHPLAARTMREAVSLTSALKTLRPVSQRHSSCCMAARQDNLCAVGNCEAMGEPHERGLAVVVNSLHSSRFFYTCDSLGLTSCRSWVTTLLRRGPLYRNSSPLAGLHKPKERALNAQPEKCNLVSVVYPQWGQPSRRNRV